MIDDTTRIPPHSNDMETALLGCMLQSDTPGIYDVITEEYFYNECHAVIFRAMKILHESHTPIDQLTVSDQLDKMKFLDYIGGIPAISDMVNRVPSAANLEHYANIIADAYHRRSVIAKCTKLISRAYDNKDSMDDFIQETQKDILSMGAKVNESFCPVSQTSQDLLDQTEQKYTSDQEYGIPTGFPTLDRMTGNLQPADLILLAARPSVGKTAFALKMMRNQYRDHNVAFFSLEMSKTSVTARLAALEKHIPMTHIRQPKAMMTEKDWEDLTSFTRDMQSANLEIDDQSELLITDIKSRSRKLHNKMIAKTGRGLDIIYVDYLQIAKAKTRSSDNRNIEVGIISSGLKALAKELNVPVVALSQLSRPNGDDPYSLPRLKDLRDSGSLEQDADLVIFLYRPYHETKKDEDKERTKAIVAKHRNGPMGDIPLVFLAETTDYCERDIAGRYENTADMY